jgi:hypothetical protein
LVRRWKISLVKLSDWMYNEFNLMRTEKGPQRDEECWRTLDRVNRVSGTINNLD